MSEQETIADIIAEMRFHGQQNIDAEKDKPEYGILTEEGRITLSYADRIEAAHRREVATTKESLAVGNSGDCAKLREALALIATIEFPHNFQNERFDIVDACQDLTNAIKTASAALSAPPRNCDRFASAEEARKAHEEYRGDYIMRASNKFDFPMAFEAWLFAPATEQEGGNDADK